LIQALPPPWVYCATAEALDDEMRGRIEGHRRRRGEGWITREEPLNLAGVIAEETRPLLVDCLTLWLSNVMLVGKDVEAEMERLLDAARQAKAPCALVSNEVGLGIVPGDALSRDFRDHSGRLHQKLASIAGKVVFMVAGLPMVLKDE
jgi:adenosylcobinamide kinase/adenosylcobinamide-phosphate guanylyltransferase